MQTAPYFCLILTKFIVSRQIFTKVLKVKFHVNSSYESALTHEEKRTDGKFDDLTEGQTGVLSDRQTE